MKREELMNLIPNYSRVKFGNAGTYVVADISEQFGSIMVGIYDEPPSNHIDYLNGENVEIVDELASYPELDKEQDKEQTFVKDSYIKKGDDLSKYALQGKEQTADGFRRYEELRHKINQIICRYNQDNDYKTSKATSDLFNLMEEYASQKQPVLPTKEEIENWAEKLPYRSNLNHEGRIEGAKWVIKWFNKHK